MKRVSERVASTAAALFLQAGFLLLLLQALQTTPARKILSREITLILPRLPAAPPVPAAPARSSMPTAIRPEVTPPASMPVPPPSVVAPIIPPSSIEGFGQTLNNCAPQNYANLPDDQKANCTRPGAGVAVQQAPNLMGMPSHVEDNDYWAAQLAARNTPAQVPCTHLENEGLGGGRVGTTAFVNPLCALNEVRKQFEH